MKTEKGKPSIRRRLTFAIVEWIERNQTSAGGWLGVRLDCNPAAEGCLNGTANVLWGLAATGRFTGTKIVEKGLEFLARSVISEPRFGRRISYPQFWNFWVDDIKLAEIYLGLGVSIEEEQLNEALASIVSLQQNDGRWLEQQGPYPQGHYSCKRMRRFFPKKGEPSKWITAKAMPVLRNASSPC